jgi:hypothetical protein
MERTKMPIVLLGLAMMASLSGCAMFNRATVTHTRTTTIGQELIDLQEAKEKGTLSDEEYDKLKKEIIEGGPAINMGYVQKCSSE